MITKRRNSFVYKFGKHFRMYRNLRDSSIIGDLIFISFLKKIGEIKENFHIYLIMYLQLI